MNKRLRKKLHVGEFTEYCFSVDAVFAAKDKTAADLFLDDFLVYADQGKYSFAGIAKPGSDGKWELSGVIGRSGRLPVTNESRDAFRHWLDSHLWVESVRVGELQDAWK